MYLFIGLKQASNGYGYQNQQEQEVHRSETTVVASIQVHTGQTLRRWVGICFFSFLLTALYYTYVPT
jgi:hypothetical protein